MILQTMLWKCGRWTPTISETNSRMYKAVEKHERKQVEWLKKDDEITKEWWINNTEHNESDNYPMSRKKSLIWKGMTPNYSPSIYEQQMTSTPVHVLNFTRRDHSADKHKSNVKHKIIADFFIDKRVSRFSSVVYDTVGCFVLNSTVLKCVYVKIVINKIYSRLHLLNFWMITWSNTGKQDNFLPHFWN